MQDPTCTEPVFDPLSATVPKGMRSQRRNPDNLPLQDLARPKTHEHSSWRPLASTSQPGTSSGNPVAHKRKGSEAGRDGGGDPATSSEPSPKKRKEFRGRVSAKDRCGQCQTWT